MAERLPWSTAMLEFLRQDHKRHLVREVITVGAQFVPPVRALHRLETDRSWGIARYGRERMDDDKLTDRETRVRKGQYRVAQHTLKNYIADGTINRDGDYVQIPRRRVVPWLEAMLSLLDDGQWHPRREVIAVGATAVPPVRALKEMEQRRKWQSKKSGTELDDSRLVDRETRVRAGQWRVASGSLSMAITRELVRVRGDYVRRQSKNPRYKKNQ